MALVVKDRVRETTTTTGTGTVTLAGAVAGFQSFSAIGNANTTYYTINLPGANEWEVGLGTYTASGTTLSRDTILASSNSGSAVNFSAGTKDVFCTYPAGRSVYYDTSTNVSINNTLDLTNLEVTNIKAKDGTAAIVLTDSTGAVTISTPLTANGGAVFNENGANVDFRVEGDTDANLIFADASADYVGIGTSSPAEKLTVQKGNGGIRLDGAGTASSSVWLDYYVPNNGGVSTSSNFAGRIYAVSSGVTDFSDNSIRIAVPVGGSATPVDTLIVKGGNLGIGTSPTARLSIGDPGTGLDFTNAASGNFNIGLLAGTGSALAYIFQRANSDLLFGTNNTERARITSTGTLNIVGAGTAGSTQAISFNGSAPVDSLVVTANGDVGLGTNTPTQRLDVRGSVYVERSTNPTNGLVAALTNQTTSSNNGCKLSFDVYNIGSAAIGVPTDNAGLAFYTNGVTSEKMRLDASGNLGIGTSSPNAKLHILAADATTADLARFQQTNQGNLLIQSQQGGLNIGSANGILFSNATGNMGWRTGASSGDANMLLDANGNLGIGTTSPGTRLHIETAAADCRLRIISGTSHDAAIQLGDTASSSQGAIIYDNTADALRFQANGSERARITSGGDLLVGSATTATSSSAGFKVLGSLVSGHWDPTVVTDSNSASASCWDIYSTATSSYRFYVTTTGVINAVNTTISAISDVRFKENIQDLDVGLDKIMALKPRKFDWKTGKGKDIKGDRGWIAQEFEQVFPDMIDTWRDPAPEGEEPYKAVRADLIPVLVKAIQEQQAMINELKAEVAALKGA
jgi:hypothetical protein